MVTVTTGQVHEYTWRACLFFMIFFLAAGCSPQPAAAGLSDFPWLFVRPGMSAGDTANTIEVVAVGDIMLGRQVADKPDPFQKVFPWISAADLALGNFEGAVAPPGVPLPTQPAPAAGEPAVKPYFLIAPAKAVEQLATAGFDLLGLANNHSLDRGLSGLAETGMSLKGAGLVPFGAAPSPVNPYTAVIQELDGIQLAFIAINAIPSSRGPEWTGEVRQAGEIPSWTIAGWDQAQAVVAVQAARQKSNAVIVSIHWGYEYDLRIDPAQRQIAQTLVDAGADVILGHHPHVVQPIEQLQNSDGTHTALVAYSLGNFVFDQGFGETGDGLALRLFLDHNGLRTVQGLPVQTGPQPGLMPSSRSTQLFERIAPPIETLAFQCSRHDCEPTHLPNPDNLPGHAAMNSISVDLTGDGTPEEVSLVNWRLRIESSATAAWESPGEWQVVDLVAGDPNLDGRQELVLALRKPDRAGIMLSHPFVLGYRGGQYRVIWGGSAASDPLVEIELDDLDGDGRQELAVLEDLHGGQGRAVSVWRWNGWGFSRVWRSLPSAYTYLRIFAQPNGAALLLVDRPVPPIPTPEN